MARLDKPDALTILTEDHSKILRMFDTFRQMAPEDEARPGLVERICADLSIHTQVEEEIFYPALEDELEDPLLLELAAVEHEVARQLISELDLMQPDDENYDAKLIILGTYIRHHIEEEQGKIFPAARAAGVDLDGIGQDILQRKEVLQTEYGMGEEDETAHPGARRQEEDGRKRSGRHTRP